MLVEILSEGTENHDRGKTGGGWLLHEHHAGDRVPLPCEGVLAVDDLYLGWPPR